MCEHGLYRLTMELTLNGSFRKVVGLGSYNIVTMLQLQYNQGSYKRVRFGCWSFSSLQHLRSSGRVPTCDSVHSWRHHSDSVAQLGSQSSSTNTLYPTQLHYTDTEPTSPYPILIIYNHGRNKKLDTRSKIYKNRHSRVLNLNIKMHKHSRLLTMCVNHENNNEYSWL